MQGVGVGWEPVPPLAHLGVKGWVVRPSQIVNGNLQLHTRPQKRSPSVSSPQPSRTRRRHFPGRNPGRGRLRARALGGAPHLAVLSLVQYLPRQLNHAHPTVIHLTCTRHPHPHAQHLNALVNCKLQPSCSNGHGHTTSGRSIETRVTDTTQLQCTTTRSPAQGYRVANSKGRGRRKNAGCNGRRRSKQRTLDTPKELIVVNGATAVTVQEPPQRFEFIGGEGQAIVVQPSGQL